jgi:hypothetical protein
MLESIIAIDDIAHMFNTQQGSMTHCGQPVVQGRLAELQVGEAKLLMASRS